MTGQIFRGDCDTDNGDDELADTHSESSDEKEPAATKAFNTPNARESHEHVDNIGCNRNEETILDTGVVEEGGTVIENEVDCRSKPR